MRKHLKTLFLTACVAAVSAAFAAPQKTVEIWSGVKMAGKTTEYRGKNKTTDAIIYSVKNPVLTSTC